MSVCDLKIFRVVKNDIPSVFHDHGYLIDQWERRTDQSPPITMPENNKPNLNLRIPYVT